MHLRKSILGMNHQFDAQMKLDQCYEPIYSKCSSLTERKIYKGLFLLSLLILFLLNKMGLFSKFNKSPSVSNSAPPPYSASNNMSTNYAPPSPPQQYDNPDKRPLPQGWISQYDPNSRKFFYVYTPTALRQWEHPADKSLNTRGESNSYYQQPQHQQPYQQSQQYSYQSSPYQQQQPILMQQQPRYGMSGGGGYGKMAAAGLGGGLLGFMLGDAIGDASHPDIIENNYYGNDYNDYGGGGFDGGFDDNFDQIGF